MSDFDLEETKYGFRWGPMHVRRSVSDPKYGVEIMIATDANPWERGKYIFVRVTPSGRKIEVRDGKGECLHRRVSILDAEREAVIEAARRADGPITLMLYRRAILDDEERRIVEDFIGKVRTLEALDKAEDKE